MTRIINEIDKKIFLEEKCFIPTMGALHKGHLSLVKLGKQSTNGKTIVSIFVNKRQFNDESDYDNYPIDLDKDIELLRNCLLYTSPSPRDRVRSRMPSSA